MKELVTIMKNQALTTSLKVAEYFGKRHDRVLRAIEKAISTLPKNGVSESFLKASYKDDSGKSNTMYYLNRDAFSFVVMGFTGKKAAEFKWKYIQAFNAMEKLLQEKATLDWQETRQLGKLTRRAETDTIKKFVNYAESQGSKNADKYFINYSQLANKIVGLKSGERDSASIKQLNRLDDVESIILRVMELEMAQCKNYKEIYKDCKKRLNSFSELVFANQYQLNA